MKWFSVSSWRQDVILNRVLRNSTYLFASYTLGALLTFLTARLLGVASFGVLGTVTVFVTSINRLFSFRMGDVVVKYMGESLAQNNARRAAAAAKAAMLMEAVTSVVAFAALYLLAPVGAVYFVKDLGSVPLFQVYGLMILFNIIYESSTGVLQVTNHFRSQALINFIQTTIMAVLLGLAAIYHFDVMGVLFIYLIGKIILGVGPALLALYWLPRTLGRDWWKTPLSEMPSWREMARFAFSTNVSATVNLVAKDNEVPIVSFFFGPLAAGYFKIGLALINTIVLVINPFISTTYPEITRAYSEKAWRSLRRLLRRVTLISAAWTVLVAVGLALLGKPLLFHPWNLLGHTIDLLSEYAPAYPAMMVMLAGYGAANIFFWNRPLLLAQGHVAYPMKVSAWAMLVKVLLMVLILPRLSSNGYIVEAVLLSGYLLVTVLLNVRKGLLEVRRAENQGQSAPLQGEPA